MRRNGCKGEIHDGKEPLHEGHRNARMSITFKGCFRDPVIFLQPDIRRMFEPVDDAFRDSDAFSYGHANPVTHPVTAAHRTR